MSNLYHKVAVASVCTVLGFVLGACREAKAASFTFAPTITFEVLDLDEQYYFGGPGRFDGRGDLVFPGNFDIVMKGTMGEGVQLAEINIGSLPLAPNTIISSAIFQAEILTFETFGLGIGTINPGKLGIFGYVGNGTVEASDFEAGVLLSSVDVSSSSAGDILSFDVTPFVNQRVSNGDTFAGFGIRALNIGGVALQRGEFSGIPPRLIIETAEPVPEPTTIFGSVLALGVGRWLKRKKLSLQNKTTTQY
jgi:hypothetical protein